MTFVLAWKKLGLDQRLGNCIVIYADDLVILCRRGKADEALLWMHEIMGKLKLTVNGEKTRVCKIGRVPGAQQQISHHCTIRLIGFYQITHALYFLYSLTLAGSLGIAVGNKSDKKKEARWLNPGKRIRKNIWTGMITRRRRAPIVIDSRRETE